MVRTAAIVLVLIQHVMLPTAPLGRTGVSLFFALSGFLITGLLMNELDGRGRLRLGHFYLRRFARLMPALVLMVTVVTLSMAAVGESVGVRNAGTALTYTENVSEILTGRADAFFGHAWSLAVEEHFYLAWPLVLLALRKRLTATRVLVAVLTICAATLALRVVLLLAVHPSQTFFYQATPVRADALLLGCAGCLAVRLGWRPGAAAGAAGLVLLTLQVYGPTVLRGPLLMSTVAGLACTLIVVASAGASVGDRRSLVATVFRAGADLSYPVYLWHSPVIVIALLAAHDDSLGLRLGPPWPWRSPTSRCGSWSARCSIGSRAAGPAFRTRSRPSPPEREPRAGPAAGPRAPPP